MRNLIIVLTVLFASVIFLAKPAAAATRLSGISVQSACTNQYGSTYSAYLLYQNTNGWRCITSRCSNGTISSNCLTIKSVNLNTECRRIYGSTAYANNTNYTNPYSWGCYR